MPQHLHQLHQKRLFPYTKSLVTTARVVHLDSLNTRLLLKTEANNYHLTIKAYPSFSAKTLLYEETLLMEKAADQVQIIDLPLKAKTYVLELHIVNITTKETYSDVLMVSKLKDSEQTILARKTDGSLLAENYAALGEPLQFEHINPVVSTFFVKYYHTVFKPSRPPYVRQQWEFSANYPPTEIFSVASNQPFIVSETGFYFVQTDTTTEDGIFINCFPSDFPDLTQLSDLVLATRYITKNAEYEVLTNTSATKASLDLFWLERGGTKEHSRELIKLYYNRIKAANQYFTTYKEGWKTDRGIIYTIFGPPSAVKKTATYEYWLYNIPSLSGTVDFYFDKNNNQYLLRRSPYYEHPWKTQIFEWRKGLAQ